MLNVGVSACSTTADATFSVFAFSDCTFELIFGFCDPNLLIEQPHALGACLKHLLSNPRMNTRKAAIWAATAEYALP